VSSESPHPSTYVRLLRLRHIELKSWQRVIFIEGAIGVSALLVMTDLASAWVLLGLPVGVAAAVKFHDLLAGILHR
jgi:hypothetical protein